MAQELLQQLKLLLHSYDCGLSYSTLLPWTFTYLQTVATSRASQNCWSLFTETSSDGLMLRTGKMKLSESPPQSGSQTCASSNTCSLSVSTGSMHSVWSPSNCSSLTN